MGLSAESWNKTFSDSPVSSGGALFPLDKLCYQIFSKEGRLLPEKTGIVGGAQISDLDGDGEPEIIERVVLTEETIPGLELAASGKQAIESEFLRVRPLDTNAQASFAVLYNTHSREHSAANAWGFQLRDTDGDGLYEIELGPAMAPAGVEPKVSFRWDKSKKTWSGPASGDHFRVLQGENPAKETELIAKNGGLGYPLIPGSPHPVRAHFDRKASLPPGPALHAVPLSLSQGAFE